MWDKNNKPGPRTETEFPLQFGISRDSVTLDWESLIAI